MKKILIVDDHFVVRHGLQNALEKCGYEITALAASLSEARAQLARVSTDAIIVDVHLPDGSGFDLIVWARSISKTIGIVVLSLNDGVEFVNAARKAGANAYVHKSASIGEITASLEFALATPKGFSSRNTLQNESGFDLTAREIDILHLLSDGLSSQAMAQQLFISTSTVKSHLTNIYRKLDVDNRVLAVKVARENALLV